MRLTSSGQRWPYLTFKTLHEIILFCDTTWRHLHVISSTSFVPFLFLIEEFKPSGRTEFVIRRPAGAHQTIFRKVVEY